jgi:hypothetical protein
VRCSLGSCHVLPPLINFGTSFAVDVQPEPCKIKGGRAWMDNSNTSCRPSLKSQSVVNYTGGESSTLKCRVPLQLNCLEMPVEWQMYIRHVDVMSSHGMSAPPEEHGLSY